MPFRLLTFVAMGLGCAVQASAADLQIVATGVAHEKGSVRLAVYSDAETFRKEDRALLVRGIAAKPGDMVATIPGLAPGRYAVIVYHDEDGDGEMDRFMGMIPTEGYGLSNNPEVTGPPRFDECAFEVAAGGVREVRINLRY